MSQIDFHTIIRQQQEQLVAIQVQIQALLAEGPEREAILREVGRGGGAEVVKPQIFNGMPSKVGEFITACKLYIRIKLREELVEG